MLSKKTAGSYSIAQIIYTYDRIVDARICMEITRKIWEEEIGKVYVLHLYNGEKSFGYQKYLEDKLIRLPNRGHFTGAADLINTGVSFLSDSTDFKYVVVTAADTWLVKPNKLEGILKKMEKENKVIACSSWLDIETKWLFRTGLSTDFFVFNLDWNRIHKLFPLKYNEYIEKFRDLCLFLGIYPYLELALAYYYLKHFADPLIDKGYGKAFTPALKGILRLKEREPVFGKDGIRKMAFPKLGLYTYHDKNPKINLLKKFKNRLGKEGKKFINDV